MDGQAHSTGDGDIVRLAVTRWVGGILLVVGLLGFLRRHFSGLVEAPGTSVLGMTTTPLGHLILFVLGCAGIGALRARRLGAVYLPGLAVVLLLLVVFGAIAGGADAGGLALNGRIMLLLVALAAAAAGGEVFARRVSAVS